MVVQVLRGTFRPVQHRRQTSAAFGDSQPLGPAIVVSQVSTGVDLQVVSPSKLPTAIAGVGPHCTSKTDAITNFYLGTVMDGLGEQSWMDPSNGNLFVDGLLPIYHQKGMGENCSTRLGLFFFGT